MFLRCDDSCFIPLFLSFCLVRCFFFLFFFLLSGSSFLQGLFSSCGVPFSHHGALSCCRAQALRHGDFSSCGSRALEHRLNSCGTWGWLLQGMWDLPGSGIELLFPALTGGFLTTEPLEKPWCGFEETLCRFVLSWRHLLNVMYVHLPNSEPSLEGRQRAEL